MNPYPARAEEWKEGLTEKGFLSNNFPLIYVLLSLLTNQAPTISFLQLPEGFRGTLAQCLFTWIRKSNFYGETIFDCYEYEKSVEEKQI